MSTYGRRVTDTLGRIVRVSADGRPRYKPGGVTIDWSVIDAVSADTTLDDGTIVKAGDKYLRYGQILTRITGGEINTLTISGSPTGGTFTITVDGQTTGGIAYNANAATIQAAIVALSTVGTGKCTVTGTGPFTLTFATSLGNLAVSADGASLTGGSSPAATIATTSEGARTDLFGPADTSAVDGRQLVTNAVRGDSYILDETVVYSEPGSDHPAVFDGGLVYKARLLMGGANQPTEANVETMFPAIAFVS